MVTVRCTISTINKGAIWVFTLLCEVCTKFCIHCVQKIKEIPACSTTDNSQILHICVTMCYGVPLCIQQRNDDEAVVDRRGTRLQQGTNFEQEDLEGTVMVLNGGEYRDRRESGRGTSKIGSLNQE